jgi:hypothetical protein
MNNDSWCPMSKKSNERKKNPKENQKKQRVDNHSLPQNPSPDYVSPDLIERYRHNTIHRVNKNKGRKYSDIILEYIQSNQDNDMSIEDYKAIIPIGIFVWNIALLKQLGQDEFYNKIVRKCEKDNISLDVYLKFTRRKIEEFGEYKFYVEDYEIESNKMGDMVLSVAVFDIKDNHKPIKVKNPFSIIKK